MNQLLHSRDYSSLLNNVIENELIVSVQNNESLWIAMGNQLVIEGIPKEQISTIVRKDIEDKLWEVQFKSEYKRKDYRYCNSKYYQVMKDNGWTNPFMARNTSIDPLVDQEIVPHTNYKMKDLSYDIINLCKIFIDKSKQCIPFEDTFGEREMNEWYKQMHTITNNCKDAIDNKTKVPKNTELFLLECLSTILGSVNKCAEIFMEQNLIRLKKQLIIGVRTGKPVPFLTLKQASKFQKGMRQSKLHILKPLTMDEALYLDYIGVQCECGSYRIRQKLDSYNLECYDCDNILPPFHISKCEYCKVPLYKERLVHIVKTGKCDNCNEIINLPIQMIQDIKS